MLGWRTGISPITPSSCGGWGAGYGTAAGLAFNEEDSELVSFGVSIGQLYSAMPTSSCALFAGTAASARADTIMQGALLVADSTTVEAYAIGELRANRAGLLRLDSRRCGHNEGHPARSRLCVR